MRKGKQIYQNEPKIIERLMITSIAILAVFAAVFVLALLG